MSKANKLASLAVDVNNLSELADQVTDIENAIVRANTNAQVIEGIADDIEALEANTADIMNDFASISNVFNSGITYSTDGENEYYDANSVTNTVATVDIIEMNIQNPQDGELLSYSTSANTWVNSPAPVIPEMPEIPPPVLSFRNKLINGGFDIWQRSEDITNENNSWGIYTADRWWHNKGRSQKITDVVDGQTVNVLRISDESVGYNGGRGLFQNIENYRYEKTVTLSAWIKASQASTINFGFIYDHTETARINDDFWIDVTTSWQKFTRTFKTTVPALGTSNQYIINDLTDGVTYDVAMIQLEEGEVATPFEQRPYGLELSLCQRYFEQILIPYGTMASYNAAQNCFYASPFTFAVTKRVTPTMKIHNEHDGIRWAWPGTNYFHYDTDEGITFRADTTSFNIAQTKSGGAGATTGTVYFLERGSIYVRADAEL